MAKVFPIQHHFSAGELSPYLQARSDIEGYQAGLKFCRNAVILRHGPASKRGGTVFSYSPAGTKAKCFGLQMNPETPIGEGFHVVVDDSGVLKVVDASGTAISSGVEALTNGGFDSGATGWASQVTASGNVIFAASTSLCLMTVGTSSYSTAKITQQITTDPGNVGKTAIVSYRTLAPSTPNCPSIRIGIGTSEFSDSLFSFSGHRNIERSFTFTVPSTSFWVTFYAVSDMIRDPGEPNSPSNPIDYTRRLAKVSVRITASTLTEVEFNHPWTSDQLDLLTSKGVPGEYAMYFLTGEVQPQVLKYSPSTDTWTFGPLAFISKPASWVDGSWPSCVGFYQGRAWWAGVRDKPETFWASKSGTKADMSPGSAQDNDSIEHTIDRTGMIRWIEGSNNLLIGTSYGEYIVTSDAGVITPSDKQVSLQSAFGSNRVQPTQVGNSVLYVSGDGRKLRSAVFQWTEQQWVSRDLTFSAEHYTYGERISGVVYSKNPDSIVWCWSELGYLIGCTYDPATGQTGWHKHEFSGFLLGCSVVERAGKSELGVLIRYGDQIRFEIYNDEVFVDSAHIEAFLDPVSSIDVPRLAGSSVQCTVDGAYVGVLTLDNTGHGVLPFEGRSVVLGIGYTMKIITLPVDFVTQRGTSFTNKRRWTKIYARLLQSAYPLINGYRPPDRRPASLMGLPEDFFTGDISVVNFGHGTGIITVEQDLPYRTTICGLFGELSMDSL